ncbi:amine oxidase [Mollisia scopiformis]|uniref:Amine oxidase n=1 Tax=Mollisia scopiformis TaxID=149040 RepID=A0A132B3L7_MOLSC|nr:amine oxidase [Mollisia scopiformis]KUJ06995.1 amine oxidase [Mollisia scopiformis]
MSSPTPHIGIVGAGVSGLRCAEILLNHGFQVTILEARDRIGGRICQSDKLGYRADIGPNWIHQVCRHPIVDLARETNTPLHPWNDKQNIYDSSGKLLPDDKSDRLSSLLWQFIEEAFTYSATHQNEISESDSLYDFVKSKAEEHIKEQEDVELLLQMSQMWGAYVGDQVSRQSLRFAWMEECCGGGEMFVESTWEAILGEIAGIPLEKAKVCLGEKVVNVQTSSRASEGGKVTLSTEKGETFLFDEVVMTTPLGFLKRNKGAFEPVLPQRLLDGIDAISVGHLEKVYITFPTAFWVDAPSTPLAPNLSPQERAKAEDTFPGYTNWLSPSYSDATNPSRWPAECWNLASFTPPNRHPTLIFYLYGESSAYLTTLVHRKSTEDHHNLLNSFFKPYYSLLSNYDATSPDCEPKAILSTEWQKDELSGFGSYCNFQVGVKDAAENVKAMRFGVPEQRLWFAGEHTAPFEELGTVAGAYLSGEGVALRILDGYGVNGSIN